MKAEIIQGGPLVKYILQNWSENLSRESFSQGNHWDMIECDVYYSQKPDIGGFNNIQSLNRRTTQQKGGNLHNVFLNSFHRKINASKDFTEQVYCKVR